MSRNPPPPIPVKTNTCRGVIPIWVAVVTASEMHLSVNQSMGIGKTSCPLANFILKSCSPEKKEQLCGIKQNKSRFFFVSFVVLRKEGRGWVGCAAAGTAGGFWGGGGGAGALHKGGSTLHGAAITISKPAKHVSAGGKHPGGTTAPQKPAASGHHPH